MLTRRQWAGGFVATPAVLAVIADTPDGDRLALTWITRRARVFHVTGMTRIRDWDRYRPGFERAVASFRPLLAADRERIVETRLRVRLAVAGETVAQVVARGGGIWRTRSTS